MNDNIITESTESERSEMNFPIWIKGDSEEIKFVDGKYDFVFKKPGENFYINITEPKYIRIPIWNKYIVIEKAFIGKDDQVHVILSISGNPVWIPVVICAAILLSLGLGIWLLQRIDRIVTPGKIAGVSVVLVLLIILFLIIFRRKARSLI